MTFLRGSARAIIGEGACCGAHRGSTALQRFRLGAISRACPAYRTAPLPASPLLRQRARRSSRRRSAPAMLRQWRRSRVCASASALLADPVTSRPLGRSAEPYASCEASCIALPRFSFTSLNSSPRFAVLVFQPGGAFTFTWT